MQPSSDRPRASQPGPDYRHLPPPVQLDETIAGVDPDPVPDPEAGQDMEQRRALQDD